MSTNITSAHSRDFNALRDPEYSNFALFSCFVNGEPTAAIVAVITEETEVKIVPLFVAVTPGMDLTAHDGTPTQEAEG